MKSFQILLASLALTGVVQAKSNEFAANVVILPAVIVQATRVTDPTAQLRANLNETRAQLVAPASITLSSILLPLYDRESPSAKTGKRTLNS